MIFRSTRQMRCDKGMVDTPLVLPIHKWPYHLSFVMFIGSPKDLYYLDPYLCDPFYFYVNHSLSMLVVLFIMCTYHRKCQLTLTCITHSITQISYRLCRYRLRILCRRSHLSIHSFFSNPPCVLVLL